MGNYASAVEMGAQAVIALVAVFNVLMEKTRYQTQIALVVYAKIHFICQEITA